MIGMRSISAAERVRVEAAVADAEAQTSAEFALVVARLSESYAPYPLLWGAVLGLVAGGIAAFFFPTLGISIFFAIQAGVFLIASLAFHWWPLRLMLVPASVKHHHARQLAQLQFAALVHDRTAEETGLLLFVALGERHVEILVDRGIARRIPEATWTAVIDDFLNAVKAGQITEGLIKAVRACTSILEKHFPPVSGDKNEIPNRLVELR